MIDFQQLRSLETLLGALVVQRAFLKSNINFVPFSLRMKEAVKYLRTLGYTSKKKILLVKIQESLSGAKGLFSFLEINEDRFKFVFQNDCIFAKEHPVKTNFRMLFNDVISANHLIYIDDFLILREAVHYQLCSREIKELELAEYMVSILRGVSFNEITNKIEILQKLYLLDLNGCSKDVMSAFKLR